MDELFHTLISDTQHWQTAVPPYAPNLEEIQIYRELIGDRQTIVLLGMTRGLLPLCDLAVDLNPVTLSKPVIRANWNDLAIKAGAIIGDGVINLERFELVKKMLKLTDRFICRVFQKKLPEMKYATFFPSEFPGSSQVIPTQDGISIVVWG